MDTVDKVNFAFNAYDFENTESLYYDELTLLFRACLKGLAKACPTQIVFTKPTNEDAEFYASLFFSSLLKDKTTDKIAIKEFQSFCNSHPVVSSWLKVLASIPSEIVPKKSKAGDDDLDLRSIKHWSALSKRSSRVLQISRAIRPTALALDVTEDDFSPPDVVQSDENGGDNAAGQSSPEDAAAAEAEAQALAEITAEEDEEAAAAAAAAYAALHPPEPPPPPALFWFPVADLAMPEEPPV